MDPEVLVVELDQLAEAIDNPDVDIRSGIEAAEEMATNWLTLRNWLRKGGYMPTADLRAQLPGAAGERHG